MWQNLWHFTRNIRRKLTCESEKWDVENDLINEWQAQKCCGFRCGNKIKEFQSESVTAFGDLLELLPAGPDAGRRSWAIAACQTAVEVLSLRTVSTISRCEIRKIILIAAVVFVGAETIHSNLLERRWVRLRNLIMFKRRTKILPKSMESRFILQLICNLTKLNRKRALRGGNRLAVLGHIAWEIDTWAANRGQNTRGDTIAADLLGAVHSSNSVAAA